MRPQYWLMICLCLVAGIGLAQYNTASPQKPAAPAAAKPDFEITASYIEACSCDMFCPCYFNTRSTMHGDAQFCRANLVLRVDKGYYKDTKLDGAKVWLSADLGSDWSTGRDAWLVITFDTGVSKEQQTALADILPQLYPFKWTVLGIDRAAFTWKIDTKTGVAQARMGNGKGEVVLERVAGANPNKEIVIQNLKYWMAHSNTGFRMWKTKHEYYEGHGKKVDYSGTNGFLITINFSGQAKPATAD